MRSLVLTSLLLFQTVFAEARGVERVIDMREMDVLVSGMEAQLAVAAAEVFVNYTISYVPDRGSWKLKQDDYDPRYFYFELPLVAAVEWNSGLESLDPSAFDVEVSSDGRPIRGLTFRPFADVMVRQKKIAGFPQGFSYLVVAGYGPLDESGRPRSLAVSYVQGRRTAGAHLAVFAFNFDDARVARAEWDGMCGIRYRLLPGITVRAYQGRDAMGELDPECQCFEAMLTNNNYFALKVRAER